MSPRYVFRNLMAVCICGALLAAVGFLLGAYEIIGPEITAISIYVSAGLAVVWLVMVPLMFRRKNIYIFKIYWRVIFFGTIVCWGGPVMAGYIFVWEPMQKIHFSEYDYSTASPVEYRSLCHRFLVVSTDPHDEFIYLERNGNETSVPYILWALQWMPPEGACLCTWCHAIKALEKITNHSAGSTREAWAQWYADNKHKTVVEWWADGFTEQGYSVSVAGGDKSIRMLFAVLGRTPKGRPDDRQWLSLNAMRMLALWDKKDIQRVIDDVLKSGSDQERRGAALYRQG